MEYDVQLTAPAQEDLREIVRYLNTLSPEAALRYYDRLTGKIESLSQNPERCPLCRDRTLRLRGIRFLVVEQYLVFFIVTKSRVVIYRILYGRRQYEGLL